MMLLAAVIVVCVLIFLCGYFVGHDEAGKQYSPLVRCAPDLLASLQDITDAMLIADYGMELTEELSALMPLAVEAVHAAGGKLRTDSWTDLDFERAI